MSIVLITGGNKGLGYDTARRLIEQGCRVYIGCRDASRGEKAAQELGAHFVEMDVTDDESVARAYTKIAEREDHIDILINNAGVSGIFKKPEDITAEDMHKVFDTNVYGIVRVTNAFIPLLRPSDNPVIVNISSGLGSFGTVTDQTKDESKINSLTYCSAKAAVSMVTLQYAKGLPGIKVNCVDPGATATALNGFRGKQTVEEGSEIIARMAMITKDGPTGKFFGRDGEMPW